MSGGAGSLVEWTNRTVHLAEGAAHSVRLGGTAGRLAKKLPYLGLVAGSTQASFFFSEAVDAFEKHGGDNSHGWEAAGGSVLGGIGAALSLTPWGVTLALAEIATDWLGLVSGTSGRGEFNANKVVGGFLRGSLGHGENSLIDTRGVCEECGGGMLGTAAQGAVSLASSPINAASTVVWGVCDWGTNATRSSSTSESPVVSHGAFFTPAEEISMPGQFELYKDQGGNFRFRLKATNGQIILASQGYKTKVSAKNGIASVQRNAAEDARFERKNSAGKFMFNLKANNGQVVGTSEQYETERACENGIKSVTRNAPGADIEDLTA